MYCLVNCIGSSEPVHEDNTDCRSGSKSICDAEGGGGRGCLGAQGPCGVNVGGVGEGDNLFILWN